MLEGLSFFQERSKKLKRRILENTTQITDLFEQRDSEKMRLLLLQINSEEQNEEFAKFADSVVKQLNNEPI